MKHINSLCISIDISVRKRIDWKMFRAASLCAFLALIFGGSCIDPKLRDFQPLRKYREKLQSVQDAARDLLTFLDRANVSSVLQPDVHELVILAVVRRAALIVGVPYKLAILDGLEEELPDVLLQPNDTMVKLEGDVEAVISKLKPLNDVVAELCEGVGSNECDRLVNAVVADDKKLLEAANLLQPAASVAEELLARKPRLVEVAQSLDVVPYVVSNMDDILEVLGKVLDLLKSLNRLD